MNNHPSAAHQIGNASDRVVVYQLWRLSDGPTRCSQSSRGGRLAGLPEFTNFFAISQEGGM